MPSESAGSQAKLGPLFEYHVVSPGCVEEVMPVTVPGTASATDASAASRTSVVSATAAAVEPLASDCDLDISPPLLHGAPSWARPS